MWAHSIIGSCVDVVLLALPLWVVFSNMMTRPKIIKLTLIFSVGFFAAVTAFIKTGMLITTDFASDPLVYLWFAHRGRANTELVEPTTWPGCAHGRHWRFTLVFGVAASLRYSLFFASCLPSSSSEAASRAGFSSSPVAAAPALLMATGITTLASVILTLGITAEEREERHLMLARRRAWWSFESLTRALG